MIATSLDASLVDFIARDERLEVIWEPELLADPGIDWMTGAKQRTPDEQARFESLLDTADVLFGVPPTGNAQPAHFPAVSGGYGHGTGARP